MNFSAKTFWITFVILAALIALGGYYLASTDEASQAPETPTKTCEPIGAQHPRSQSDDCPREAGNTH